MCGKVRMEISGPTQAKDLYVHPPLALLSYQASRPCPWLSPSGHGHLSGGAPRGFRLQLVAQQADGGSWEEGVRLSHRRKCVLWKLLQQLGLGEGLIPAWL